MPQPLRNDAEVRSSVHVGVPALGYQFSKVLSGICEKFDEIKRKSNNEVKAKKNATKGGREVGRGSSLTLRFL